MLLQQIFPGDGMLTLNFSAVPASTLSLWSRMAIGYRARIEENLRREICGAPWKEKQSSFGVLIAILVIPLLLFSRVRFPEKRSPDLFTWANTKPQNLPLSAITIKVHTKRLWYPAVHRWQHNT